MFCQGDETAWGAAPPHTVSQKNKKNSTLEISEARRKQLFRDSHTQPHTYYDQLQGKSNNFTELLLEKGGNGQNGQQ